MTPLIAPARPNAAWLARYLEPSLIEAPPYKIDTPKVAIKLDQNESPWDWPRPVKEKIVARLLDRPWNRYPTAFADELCAQVGSYAGVTAESVLLGPGSNYLVSLVLSVFGKGFVGERGRANRGKMVIARPSFPLYESHCRYDGIPYQTWDLDQNLEYDVKQLPDLAPGSMLVFASPNNPVGNALPYATLASLLLKHPEVLFVADEAYVEYTTEPYIGLLAAHPNLLLLRTFSKTMGFAGVRLGYVLGHADLLISLKKLRLPFLLNYFALAAAEVVLSDPAAKEYLETTRRNAIRERQRVFAALQPMGDKRDYFVKSSEANFLLVRWPAQDRCKAAYEQLIQAGILVRNVSGGPGLSGCLRITMGDERENDAAIAAFGRL